MTTVISESYREDTGICVLCVNGPLRRPDGSKDLLRRGCELAEDKGSSLLLFDLREAKVIGDSFDAFEVASEPEEQGFKRHYRIACVYTGDLAEHRFMETVGRNRGYAFRIFTSLEDAAEWLTAVPAP